MPSKIEYIADGGLVIMREALPVDLMTCFAYELTKHISSLILTSSQESPDAVVTHDTGVDHMLGLSDMPATKEVLARMRQADSTINSFTINFQPTTLPQEWHDDNTEEPVSVIHASKGGAYDYAPDALTPEEAEADHETIDLGVGDIVMQMRAGQYHRGRSKSNEPRITAATWYDSQFQLT